MNIELARDEQIRLAGWLAYACAALSSIGLLSHILIYASGAVVPFTRSHSIPVESLGVVNFFTWSLFALAICLVLQPRASYRARLGLGLGVIGFLYLSVLHLLFVFEVLWFSDSNVLFLVGCGTWAVWLVTVWYLTRDGLSRAQGNAAVNVLLTFLSILAYPLWPILLWRRFLMGVFKGERSHA